MNNNNQRKRSRKAWLISKSEDFKDNSNASELDKYDWNKGTDEADIALGENNEIVGKRRKISNDKVCSYIYIIHYSLFTNNRNSCILIRFLRNMKCIIIVHAYIIY